jgi:uncharacterized protein (UPF0332 family)
MKEIMDFDICKKEHLKSVEPDKAKITSIRRMCKARQKLLSKAELDSETAPVIASDYYEIIKELLIALLLKNSLKSDNHECLISFFMKNHPQYEYEAKVMHQLKEVRNRASYDGVFVKKEYVLNNILEFKGIIGLLDKLLEED